MPLGHASDLIWYYKVNTMAADALAPCVARTSAAMILTMCKLDILDFLGNAFQQPVMFPLWEMMQNAYSYFMLSQKKKSFDKGQ